MRACSRRSWACTRIRRPARRSRHSPAIWRRAAAMPDGAHVVGIEQGYEMGRASQIELTLKIARRQADRRVDRRQRGRRDGRHARGLTAAARLPRRAYMETEIPIIPVTRLDLRFEPVAWRFAVERRDEIDAHFAKLRVEKPEMWNGRVLLLRHGEIAGGTLSRRVSRDRLRELHRLARLGLSRHDDAQLLPDGGVALLRRRVPARRDGPPYGDRRTGLFPGRHARPERCRGRERRSRGRRDARTARGDRARSGGCDAAARLARDAARSAARLDEGGAGARRCRHACGGASSSFSRADAQPELAGHRGGPLGRRSAFRHATLRVDVPRRSRLRVP